MDENELYDRCTALLDRWAGRLPPVDLEQYRQFNDVGEWGELVDNLAAWLTKSQVPISTDERDDFSALLHGFDVPVDGLHYVNDRDHVLASLNVQDPG